MTVSSSCPVIRVQVVFLSTFSAFNDVSHRLREAESLAHSRQEALVKAEVASKASREALNAAEEQVDKEKRKAEKMKEEKEEAEERATRAEKKAEATKKNVEELQRELKLNQVSVQNLTEIDHRNARFSTSYEN